MAVDDVNWVKPRNSASPSESLHSRFEDGTLPFLNIIALSHAMDAHTKLFGALTEVSRYTGALAAWVVQKMKSMKHGNGLSVCRIYGRDDVDWSAGGTIGFTLLTFEGHCIGHVESEKLAAINGELPL